MSEVPRFQIWFAPECNEVGLSRLAEACAARRARESGPAGEGHRLRARPSKRYLPKKELGEYRDGKRVPSAVVAFRIGEALRDCGVMYASGPLALFVAAHDADAIAILGRCSDIWATGIIFRWADPLVRYRHGRPIFATDEEDRKYEDWRSAEERAIEVGGLDVATRPLQQITAQVGGGGLFEAARWWFPPARAEQRERKRHRDLALVWLASHRPISRYAFTIVADEAIPLNARRDLLDLLIKKMTGTMSNT